MLDNLYENIGGKIKIWAKWIFIIEAIGAIITGICFLADRGFEEGWWALIIIVCGPIVALVSTWILYAFGELVEDIHDMSNAPQMKNIDRNLQLLANSIIREAEEKVNQEAEERAKREAEERAKREAEEKVKREVEEKKLQEAVAARKEKPLSEKLTYALRFQSDEGMIRCLKDIDDQAVQSILKSPTHLIRAQIQELLEKSQ